MIYKIVNISDPYTIEAMSFDVAAVACFILGAGQYSFEPVDDKAPGVPMFLFGGSNEWAKETFQKNIQQLIDGTITEKNQELADCLDSCLYGHVDDRMTYLKGLELIDDPDKRKFWRDNWLDKRSSLNNIGGRAFAMARKFREGSTTPLEPAPQQVFTS